MVPFFRRIWTSAAMGPARRPVRESVQLVWFNRYLPDSFNVGGMKSFVEQHFPEQLSSCYNLETLHAVLIYSPSS